MMEGSDFEGLSSVTEFAALTADVNLKLILVLVQVLVYYYLSTVLQVEQLVLLKYFTG